MRKQRPTPVAPFQIWMIGAVVIAAVVVWIGWSILRRRSNNRSSSTGYPLSEQTLNRALTLDKGLDRPLKELSSTQLVDVLMRALTRIQNRTETEQEESKAEIEQLATDPAQHFLLRFMLTKLRTDEFFVDFQAFCKDQLQTTLPVCTPEQLVAVRTIPLCVFAHAVSSAASPDVLGALAIFQIRLESILDGRPVVVTQGIPDLVQRMHDRVKTLDASTCARCDPS